MITIKQQKKSSSIIPLAVLTGVAIGATISLLFAPKKGKESRKWLREKMDDLTGLFGTAIMDALNETEVQSLEQMGDKTQSKLTMHATTSNGSMDAPASKAAAMVNHLKNTKREDGQHPEPM